MPSSLPSAVETSRSKYKNLNARFLRWLSCRAEDMKITSLDELDSATDQPTVAQSAPKPKVKGSKGRSKKGSTSGSPHKSSLSTEMSVGFLVKLAEKM